MKKKENAPKATISGKVTFEGQPVPDADIYLLISNPASGSVVAPSTETKVCRSGKDGTFRFTRPQSKPGGDPVSLYLTALHPRYAIGWATLSSLSDTSGISIPLPKNKPLSGQVVDPEGKPVSHAEVWVSHMFARNGREMFQPGSSISFGTPSSGVSTTTDAGGKFTLSHMPDGMTAGMKVKRSGFASQYRWNIMSGSDTLTFVLPIEGKIEGKVTFPDTGKPVPNAHVYGLFIQRSDRSSSIGEASATADKNGKFLLSGLMPGAYSLVVLTQDGYPEWVSKPKENVTVEEGKTTPGADLVLSRGGLITGRITEQDTGAPVVDQMVQVQQATRAMCKTDENGMYRIMAIPGETSVYASPTGIYTSADSYPTRKVTVAEGDTVRGIDFQFIKGIEVKGTTRTLDGKPVAGVRVSASTAFGSMGGKMTTSDAQGRFTVTGFKPGERVTLDANQYEMHLRSKVDLDAKPGTEIDIVMNPYKTTKVEGRIFKPDGSPAPGVEIWLMRWEKEMGQGMSSVAAVSDKEGKFSISDLEIGKDYGLSAQHSQVQTDTFTLTETTKPFELKLPKADRWLAGVVTGADGAPLSGIRVIVNGGPSGLVEMKTDEKGRYRLDSLVAQVEEVSLDGGPLGWFRFKYVITNHNRDFALVAGDRFLAGVVRDPGGKPVPGANLSVSDDSQGRTGVHASADSEGKFRLEKLSHAEETVEVYTRDGRYKTFPNVETNRDGVVFTLDPAPQPNSPLQAAAATPSSAPPHIGAPYPVKVAAGKAAIVVDGSLADWTAPGAKVEPVRYGDPVNLAKIQKTTSPEPADLAMEFQCRADKDFVYFAVKVTDDKLRFGYNCFENPFWDDGIEFLFYGDQKAEYTGQISISAEKDGALKLEGRDPVTNEKYPYFWQAVGVKAALKQRAGGYDVELAVPWSVLSRLGWKKGSLTGMNLLAYDRDSEKPSLSGIGGLLEWAASPDETYGLLAFDSIPSPEGLYTSESSDTVYAVLENIKNSEWAKAETALAAAGNGLWVKPMLAIVQKKAGERDRYLQTFIEAAKTAPNPSVAGWAVEQIYIDLRIHERQGKEDDTKVRYDDLLQLTMSDNLRMDISLAVGRNYLMSGEFEKSRQILDTLMQSPFSRPRIQVLPRTPVKCGRRCSRRWTKNNMVLHSILWVNPG